MKSNSRRHFLKSSALTVGALSLSSLNLPAFANNGNIAPDPLKEMYPFKLPPLGYGYNALEPFIDAKTMEIHHTKHHQAYIDKLNAALEKNEEFKTTPLNILFGVMDNLPGDLKTAVLNHGGGHVNHSLFWTQLTDEKNTQPSESLLRAITAKFTSLDNLKTEMNKSALGVFGSGWAWLIKNPLNGLEIVTSPNQQNPVLTAGGESNTILLGIDVWEHAYYLKHQNKRADYLNDIWNVINWKQVSQNFGV